MRAGHPYSQNTNYTDGIHHMSGAASRSRGNRYEVELTHYLSQQLDMQVVTSRDGRGGAQGGSDLQFRWNGCWHPHVRGWAVEAKDVKNKAVPTWLRQAAQEAEDDGADFYVVLHRTRGTGDRNEDRAYLPRRMLLDWLLYGQRTVDTYDPSDYLELTAGQWCEAVS